MEPIKLYDTKHPDKEHAQRYENLIGLDKQKRQLLTNLQAIFSSGIEKNWQKKHHPEGLHILNFFGQASPLILLSGDVGCGKTELASCIGTPLAKALNGATVRVFQTPSDTRGSGKVGELSARITAAFRMAQAQLKPKQYGILIIDEADDLATDRDQQQAHHEDRAGVNALIKEIDRLKSVEKPLSVLLITNRTRIMDPAVLRRATVDICFHRPVKFNIQLVLEHLLDGVSVTTDQIDELVQLCQNQQPLFSYSDFFNRIARQAVLHAQANDEPYSFNILQKIITETKPSPEINQS